MSRGVRFYGEKFVEEFGELSAISYTTTRVVKLLLMIIKELLISNSETFKSRFELCRIVNESRINAQIV